MSAACRHLTEHSYWFTFPVRTDDLVSTACRHLIEHSYWFTFPVRTDDLMSAACRPVPSNHAIAFQSNNGNNERRANVFGFLCLFFIAVAILHFCCLVLLFVRVLGFFLFYCSLFCFILSFEAKQFWSKLRRCFFPTLCQHKQQRELRIYLSQFLSNGRFNMNNDCDCNLKPQRLLQEKFSWLRSDLAAVSHELNFNRQQPRTECDGGGSLMVYAPLGAMGISK